MIRVWPTIAALLVCSGIAFGQTSPMPSDAQQHFGSVWFNRSQFLTPAQQSQARVNIGSLTKVTIQQFTASGTYTPTPGMQYAIIECIGGGGGGGAMQGGVASQYFWGGGGGSGGYSRHLATATDIGASQTVTIGAFGAGGVAGGTNDGSAGGDTSLGALCIGKGGAGGKSCKTDGTTIGAGGAGGVAGTGNMAIAAGFPGNPGMFSTAPTVLGAYGGGGSSMLGGGAAGKYVSSSATVGGTAGNYGSGGGGGLAANNAGTANGGAGSSGIVIITEFGF